jgi:hypothetical protein
MSFKDGLIEIMKSASAAKDEHQKSLAKAREWWAGFRDQEIKPAFDEAVAAWKEGARVYSATGRKNGDSIYLAVGPPEKAPEHDITFRFHDDTGAVSCQSSEKALSESYEKGSLTTDKVREKVREFVREVIEKYI